MMIRDKLKGMNDYVTSYLNPLLFPKTTRSHASDLMWVMIFSKAKRHHDGETYRNEKKYIRKYIRVMQDVYQHTCESLGMDQKWFGSKWQTLYGVVIRYDMNTYIFDPMLGCREPVDKVPQKAFNGSIPGVCQCSGAIRRPFR